MPFGLQVVNEGGLVQIDQDFRNIAVIQQGTFGAAGPVSSGVVTFSAQSEANCPQVWVRPHSDGVWVGGCFLTDASENPYSNSIDRFFYQAGGPCDYKVCALSGNFVVDQSSYGLQVFDQAGRIAFDSRRRYARIRRVLSVASSSSSSVTVGFSGIPERPWMLLNQLPFCNFEDGFYGHWSMFGSLNGTVSATFRCSDSPPTWFSSMRTPFGIPLQVPLAIF